MDLIAQKLQEVLERVAERDREQFKSFLELGNCTPAFKKKLENSQYYRNLMQEVLLADEISIDVAELLERTTPTL